MGRSRILEVSAVFFFVNRYIVAAYTDILLMSVLETQTVYLYINDTDSVSDTQHSRLKDTIKLPTHHIKDQCVYYTWCFLYWVRFGISDALYLPTVSVRIAGA